MRSAWSRLNTNHTFSLQWLTSMIALFPSQTDRCSGEVLGYHRMAASMHAGPQPWHPQQLAHARAQQAVPMRSPLC